MIITIDGPTASGKSTVAALLAQRLGFLYLSTGWIYRALVYLLIKQYGYTEQQLLHPSEKDIKACLDLTRLNYTHGLERGGILYYDGVDISFFLKDCSIDKAVAIISPLPLVRTLVSQTQKDICQHARNSIVEGRDTGSVVFPHAHYKFYLTASLEIRAARWKKDQEKRGHTFTIEQAIDAVAMRDKKDLERIHSPLVIPKGALVIDCSSMTAKEVVDQIISVIKIS